jgi:hypothetical protein
VLIDFKPDGGLDPVIPLCDEHIDAQMDDYLERAADLLEAEVAGMRDRQRRVRAGQAVGWRQVVIDEFQVGTGSPGSGEVKKGSPQRRIRDAGSVCVM